MKKKITSILLLIILLLSSILTINSQIIVKSNIITSKDFQENESQFWAVIIAVGDIKRDSHGVNMLTDILVSHGCPVDHIKKYIEENATKDNILNDPFEWLKTSDVKEEDIVIFYFSMHGDRIKDQHPLDEPDNYDEYLVSYKSDKDSNNSILDDELSEKFNELYLKNLVLIFETCYSGGMIDGSHDLSKSGRIVITSCNASESSWPIYIPRRWLFPHYFFRGLLGFANLNKDRWITAEEAFRYAERWTILRSNFLARIFSLIPFIPHGFVPQHPQLYDGWPSEYHNYEELNLIRPFKRV